MEGIEKSAKIVFGLILLIGGLLLVLIAPTIVNPLAAPLVYTGCAVGGIALLLGAALLWSAFRE